MSMIGQVLNHRYEILEKLGEGGMALAYRGRDRVLGRVVAVKVMRPELASDAEFLSRFRREARAAAGVTHEHIAGVYDTGSDGPNHYIVMEYVEGESLRDRLRREGPLSLSEAVRISTETAEALEAAHAAGIVHRDIKPHNILLGREGQVKVTDFGIARAMAMSSQTETGRIVGSVGYVSPEQARGDTVGPQSDLYSLGVTLFEMLTGRTPFAGGDRLAVLHKHIYDRPPLVGEFRRGLPAEIESLVDRCLEKDLSRRFASAREVIGYLGVCPRAEAQGWQKRLSATSRVRHLARGMDGIASRLRRRALLLSATMLVLTVLLIWLAVWLPLRGLRAIRVPDLVGMSAAAAQVQVAAVGLKYRELGRRPSEDVAVGSIMSQDPSPGQRTAGGTVVKVVISEGSDQVVVPDVSEMALPQAEMNLRAARLGIGKVREGYDEHVPRNYVRTTLPASGAKVVKGTRVHIELSLGPKPTVAPALPTPPLPSLSPGQIGHRETITFIVPQEGADRDAMVTVTVEVEDDRGRRVIYDQALKPGESIPPQTLQITTQTTVRILVGGVLQKQQTFLP